MVSPFLGVIFDSCFNDLENAPVTNTFDKSFEVNKHAHCRDRKAVWSTEDLRTLNEKISDFKQYAVETFGPYKHASMGTRKFHMLDHPVDDIEKAGGIECFSGSLYENSNKSFKEHYSLTSQRNRTVMNETLQREEDRQIFERSEEKINRTKMLLTKE